MESKTAPAARHATGWFHRFSEVTLELAILYAIVTIFFTALHTLATHHANIDETGPGYHVAATVDDPGMFHPGGECAVYRFSPEWQSPIGHVRVDGKPSKLIDRLGEALGHPLRDERCG